MKTPWRDASGVWHGPRTCRCKPPRDWRRIRRVLWKVLRVAVVIAGAAAWFYLITLNAYDAGHAVGWQNGYDAASVKEAEAWSKVPKANCPTPPPDFGNIGDVCERWFYEHNPVVNELFKSDPRQSK